MPCNPPPMKPIGLVEHEMQQKEKHSTACAIRDFVKELQEWRKILEPYLRQKK